MSRGKQGIEKEEETMIKVVVADYCQNCPRFEAAAGKRTLYIGKDAQGETKQYVDTEIRCANARICAAIEAHIRKKIENENPQPEPKKEPEAEKNQEKQESKWAKWWKRLADRLRWIDVWDALGAAAIALAATAAIFVALMLVILSAAIIRGSLRI